MKNNQLLLEKYLALKCVGVDGFLHAIDGRTCDDVPNILIAKLGEYSVVYYKEHFRDLSKNEHSVREELTYCFDSAINNPNANLVTARIDTGKELDEFAVIVDGSAVSRAWSVRRNHECAEIAVETKEGHRRLGYGKAVIIAWINYQLSIGKMPFYNHRKYNLESKGLAESVGAKVIADVTSLFL